MLYRFGAYELDEAKGELRREGRAVAIQPKPLALLALLIRERERVVPADEILATLWPDTAVTPGSLNRAVSHARRAIGDTNRGRVIRSVPRRGYRFAAEVRALERPTPAAARAAPPERPFVGRGAALGTVRGAWAGVVAAERSAIALVSGPPGIGKTRLCEVAVAEVEGAGGLVLTGRAREGEGVPAFWLWAQVLRRLQETFDSEETLREVVRHGSELAELLGIDAPVAGTPRSPEQSRFLLLDGIARALERAARRRPLLVWLEDLQWAGAESLRGVEHLAHERLEAPLLLLATVREEKRNAGDPVARTLALLRAEDAATEVALGPLTRAEVAALAERTLGRPPPADLTSELSARTEGVPLFLREALRLLAERDALREPERIAREGIQLPPRALDLIRRPLDRLSPPCARAVAAAAVLGREFDLLGVSEVAACGRAEALEALDEATRAGIVEETGAAAGFRFTHALFQ